jgi:hypothetical protein
MKRLSKDQFNLAKQFMKTNARALEKSLFEYEFESGSRNQVYEELKKFQNEDGGFGHGIEPDLRCEDSSALGTSSAFQYLARIHETNSEMAQKAIQYLVDSYDEKIIGWHIIPREAENAPRAMWWDYGAFNSNWGNPNAEILSYLLGSPSRVSSALLEQLTQYAMEYLLNECDLKEMHEMVSYLRLADRLPHDQYSIIADKLHIFVDNCIVKNPEDRIGYTAPPLLIIESPQSRYYEKFADIIPYDLDQLIASQSSEGTWDPNWTWGRYEDEWEKAKQEWKGIITLNQLRVLRNFNRIDF